MLTYLLKNRKLFWQGKTFDLWTIPHTLSGFLIAYLFVWYDINIWIGFFVSLSLALAWEWVEKITNLSKTEPRINGIGDIIVAQVGYLAGVYIFETYIGTGISDTIATASLLILTVITTLGWISHTLYGK